MPVWLDYGIPLAGLLAGALTLYHTIVERLLKIQHQLGEQNAAIAEQDQRRHSRAACL